MADYVIGKTAYLISSSPPVLHPSSILFLPSLLLFAIVLHLSPSAWSQVAFIFSLVTLLVHRSILFRLSFITILPGEQLSKQCSFNGSRLFLYDKQQATANNTHQSFQYQTISHSLIVLIEPIMEPPTASIQEKEKDDFAPARNGMPLQQPDRNTNILSTSHPPALPGTAASSTSSQRQTTPQRPQISLPNSGTKQLITSGKVAIPRQRATTAPRYSRRVPRACQSCRQRKTKCSGDTPVCRQCKELRVQCDYPVSWRERTDRYGLSPSFFLLFPSLIFVRLTG